MTTKEFRVRDIELLETIAFYHAQNAECEKQISINNAEIVDLERQRIALRMEYETTPPQRNLQGEIIKKEEA